MGEQAWSIDSSVLGGGDPHVAMPVRDRLHKPRHVHHAHPWLHRFKCLTGIENPDVSSIMYLFCKI